MNFYIGIDLGTSGVKLLLVDKNGDIHKEVAKSYPISYPYDNWSEQNPSDWWSATKEGVKELIKDLNADDIKGISFGGQMHGLVVLDKNNQVIRPAILWNDGRSQKEVEYLNKEIGKETLTNLTGNVAFSGFTAPKIMWMKNNEFDFYQRISMILLPKDYLNYCFTGIFASDYSDASGTLLLDVKNKIWSKEMCDIIGVTLEQLPNLYESYEVVSTILPGVAQELGLPKTIKIIAGAGDNAAAAIGTGCVKEKSCTISLGTSGTVFIPSDTFVCDFQLPIHSFDHANGKYHLMGCILSAASCNKWWVEDVLTSSHQEEQKEIEKSIGKNEVYFLPYLMGERCPHNDVSARGAFIGMRSNTTRQEMTLAVLEGVAFALKDCLEIALSKGLSIDSATLCGGGAKSKTWANIIANVLNIRLDFVETEQGPSYGAAILAMAGCKEYENVEIATNKIVHKVSSIYPSAEISASYQSKYDLYKELYKSLKNCFNHWK